MSFSVRLATDLIAVEAGATVPLSIEVTNKGAEADRYELQIEGIDPEWTAVPEAVFIVDPGETHTEKLFFKVPRVSESLSGNYPFVVKVRSLNSGDPRTVQGVVQVKPFHYLTMEIGPKKGVYSTWRKQNSYTATILNLGNTEHTLQLFGNDPDEACTYEFEHEQIAVSPGQQKTVEFTVVPSSTGLLASSRLHGFSISGRSVESPNVMTSAQAQLEQRPALTPAALTFLILLVVIVVGWIALIPKPPTIAMNLSQAKVVKGESVKVSWHAQNATTVRVLANGQPFYEGSSLEGGVDYVAKEAGDVQFEATAARDQKTISASASLHVENPPPVPAPLATIKAKRRTINLGETVELIYSVQNADEVYLQPINQKLPPTLTSWSVQPAAEGTITYEIVATGKDGQVARDRTTVTVLNKSKIVFLDFSAKPDKLDVGGGYVTLSWQVSNAARIEIQDGKDTLVPDNPNALGSKEFMIDKTTTFILKAIDASGKSVVKSIKVEVAEPDIPPVGPPDNGVPPTGTNAGGPR